MSASTTEKPADMPRYSAGAAFAAVNGGAPRSTSVRPRIFAYIAAMADDPKTASPIPTLEDWQHWTLVMGRAQQMLMEFWAQSLKKEQPFPAWSPPAFGFGEAQPATDPMALMSAGAQAWAKGLETW